MSVLARTELEEDLPPALSRDYSAVAGSVPLARSALVAIAKSAGADDDQLEAVRLAVSEALTNAVIHAYPAARAGRIHVVAWTDRGELIVEIADDGLGFQTHTDTPGLGMGLGLISQVTDDFTIRQPHSGGTAVRMRFWLRPQADA
jgi:serine/threonine-protein kinase RsbW/stage II sporulation protein AB (anti-sigma F factor)